VLLFFSANYAFQTPVDGPEQLRSHQQERALENHFSSINDTSIGRTETSRPSAKSLQIGMFFLGRQGIFPIPVRTRCEI
jgi:hypothetical protein